MAARIVQGLRWARAVAEGPFGPAKARGVKAFGLRYERALAAALPSAKHGQWFEFADANGKGFCQPDLLLAHAGQLFILEAKLKNAEEAHRQLEGLYKPVVEMALSQRPYGFAVVRSARGIPRWMEYWQILPQALEGAAAGRLGALHWRERVPLALPRPTQKPLLRIVA